MKRKSTSPIYTYIACNEVNEINEILQDNDVCLNEYCDHLDNSTEIIKIEPFPINHKFTLNDLINLGNSYHCKCQEYYLGIDLYILCKLVKPLKELDNMIGLKKIKQEIVEQIIYFIQGYDNITMDMLHTILLGPPGVGKTELSKILAKIYCNLNLIENENIIYVKRSDLIGQYLGETAIKTQKKIDMAKNGVLLIDEAYSLGNADKKDTFSKECIDTINQNLTDNKCNFICIIVGYEDSLDNCFFSYNEGLKRRFTFKYIINEYDSEELYQILELKLNKLNYSFHESLSKKERIEYFKNKKSNFPYFGGDIETLLLHLKIVHSNRVFTLLDENKKKITLNDLDNALERLNNFRKNKNNDMPDFVKQMYV